MSLAGISVPVTMPRFPRVSGDEPGYAWSGTWPPEFSPRERG